jgi:putative DNA primase/helicase
MSLEDLTTESLAPPVELTEDALALAFSRRYGDDWLHVAAENRNYRWRSTHYQHERTLAIYDEVRKFIRPLVADVENERLRAKLESAATVHAIVSLVRTDRAHARVAEDFDRDAWMVNTPAGTVDTPVSLTPRPHRRQDLLTKITPVAPAPSVTAPHWRACLATWTGSDQELIDFLQRLCGYWCTGSVREEVLAFFYGTGGNGKSVFLKAAAGALGPDYAVEMHMDALMASNSDRHPTEIAALRGKRLAYAIENDEGRRLAEAKLKQLTGGDPLTGRWMRGDFFSFAPTHKLVMVGNHRPALRNVDEAMRRRFLLIPFTVSIAPDQIDRTLGDKLAAERPGILGWMLEGCRLWLERGLDPPETVLAATNEYLESADAFSRWQQECCALGPTEAMTRATAFAGWRAWAEASGEYVGTARRLCERLRTVPGVEETKSGDRTWSGIGLNPRGQELLRTARERQDQAR